MYEWIVQMRKTKLNTHSTAGMKILTDIEAGTNQDCVSLMRLFKTILMKL